MSSYGNSPSFQEHHLDRLGKLTRSQPAEIQSAGHILTHMVSPIPDDHMLPGPLIGLHQSDYLSTQDIVYLKGHMHIPEDREAILVDGLNGLG